LCVLPSSGQNLLTGVNGAPPSLVGSDLAVIEAKDPRKDLPCTAISSKPLLGFDLRFHSGFDVSVPLKELAGTENQLTMVFRVAPVDKPEQAVWFNHKVRVPSIEAEAKGDAYLQGFFDVGEGKYQVDWLMRDRSERVCSSYWEIEAQLPPKDKQLAMMLLPGQVAATDKEQFVDEPPVTRADPGNPVNVKVLVNFAPQNSLASSLQPADTTALISILRCLQREPRFTRFSVVAFNLQEQKVLYRQQAGDFIDIPAIGDALKSLQLGRVDFAKMQQKNGETEFLANLLKTELITDDNPDAVIIAGPKAMLEQNVPPEQLRSVGDPTFPVFYMNYSLNPQLTPWRDAISNAVRHMRGQEYTISRPRDLWNAVTDIVGKVVRSKSEKRATSAALH
jgi:hypothetical protein